MYITMNTKENDVPKSSSSDWNLPNGFGIVYLTQKNNENDIEEQYHGMTKKNHKTRRKCI